MADVIRFDPTGKAGADPADVVSLLSMVSNVGLCFSQGPDAPLRVGDKVAVTFKVMVANLQTGGEPSVGVGGPTRNVSVWRGDGRVTDTGKQFVLCGEYHAAVGAVAGDTIVLTPDLAAGRNVVVLYAQNSKDPRSANENNADGLGYPPCDSPADTVPILTAQITQDRFTSTFTVRNGTPVPLDQYWKPGACYEGVQTVSGNGNASLSAAVTESNPSYFLDAPTGFYIGSVPTNTPVTTTAAAGVMHDGAKPGDFIGAVNGQSTGSILMQCGSCNWIFKAL